MAIAQSLTTHGNLWPPGGTIRTGVPVCVELSRPTRLTIHRAPTDRCGPRPKASPPKRVARAAGSRRLSWEGSAAVARRGATRAALSSGLKARIQGPPLGPWPTAVRRPHGPTARPFKDDRPTHLSTRVRQGYSPEGQRHGTWLCS
jgi:hypothetical protein